MSNSSKNYSNNHTDKNTDDEEQLQRIKKKKQQQQHQSQNQELPQQNPLLLILLSLLALLCQKNTQQQTQNDEQDGQCGADNTCTLFLSSSLGWTPELYNKINKVKCGESSFGEWSQAIFYSFAFLVDLADAIFDLILAFQTLYGGGDDGGKGLGILLGIMTIVGRFITGLYGGFAKRSMQYDEDELTKAGFYLFMELTVFLLEDGAAILLLAKTTNSSSLDVLQTISLCLTLICAGAFILVVFGIMVHLIRQNGACCYACGQPFFIAVIVFPTFMIWILIQEVMVKGEDDSNFSGGLELASYIIYGVGSFIIGLFSIFMFIIDL